MKHLLTSLLLLAALLLPTTALAYDFEVDGIYYNIINDNEVEVTYKDYQARYTGDITIPASVTNNGIVYSVTTIGSSAFSNCSGLTSVDIPNSVTTIGDGAFSGCSSLTSIDIPNSVTTIGDWALYGCSSLTSIDIPSSVTYIGESAFYDCSSLTNITIPNSVTHIGYNALQGTAWYDNQSDGLVYAGLVAYQYKGTMPEGTSITLNEGTKEIADYAFHGCSNLLSIDIPNSVTYIGEGAFESCSSLASINIPNSVTYICDYAFSNCSSLTSIDIPNSVTTIGHETFYGCSSLTSIDIPNSVTDIGALAFAGCSSLTSIDIPNTVTTIDYSAFSGCSSLTSIDIPNSVTDIGDYAFFECSGLTNLNIGNSVKTIGASAFDACTSLTSINIPNSVTSIGECAFGGCRLSSVKIPNSVTSIGNDAFCECYSLEEVYCFILNPSEINMGTEVFDNSGSNDYSNRTLYVSYGKSDDFQTDAKWSSYFGSIMEMDPVPATAINLNKTAAVLLEGETIQLNATVLPDITTIQTVSWASSNPAVAMVDSTGLVTAVGVGAATITAVTTDGSNLSATCQVTVATVSDANGFVIRDAEVLHGEAITVPVELVNEETILAFQTDIYLPEGFSLATNEAMECEVEPSSRLSDDHQLMTEAIDGGVRLLCFTPDLRPIEGNGGEVFYLTVLVPEDAAGDYAIYLRNTLLTTARLTELHAPDAGAVLTVKTFLPGDANDSRTVTVTDIVVTAQHVLGRNPSPFVAEAADMNGDGEVTVTDIMLIAQLVKYPNGVPARLAPAVMAADDHMSGEAITNGSSRRVSIALDNVEDYSAFQLDLTMPEGFTASNFELTSRAGSHILDVDAVEGGKTRVLCYSPAIDAISGHEGAVLTFDVTAQLHSTMDGEITVDGIELVTTACRMIRPGAFTIGMDAATAVSEMSADKTVARVDYYNVAGQRLLQPTEGVTLVVTTYSDGTRAITKLHR